MKFKQRTLTSIADMICGNYDPAKSYFRYRSSSYLTEFFQDCDTDYRHDGSTRRYWVAGALEQILADPHSNAAVPPESFARVVRTLMDQGDALNEGPDRPKALALLNVELAREGFEAFYTNDKQCYLRHIATNTVGAISANPHRPFSSVELKRREQVGSYLDIATEDALIGEILLPLFRQLGFHRVSAVGHKDKALEYGKDVWMKFTLPTQHVLYFGLQAKKDKIDAAGVTKKGKANVAEILNQVQMMVGHEIFELVAGNLAGCILRGSSDLKRALASPSKEHPMSTRIPASQRTREELTALIEGRLSTASAKDELVKLATRLIVEEALEEEAGDTIGRDYYEHGAQPGQGYRNGYRTGRLKTAEGAMDYSAPQIAGRDELSAWRSGGISKVIRRGSRIWRSRCWRADCRCVT